MGDPHLDAWVRWVLEHHERDVDFIVLYGSRARGRHSPHSDYDLLVGLKEGAPRKSFRERLEDFDWGGPVHMEAKPFSPEDLERLWFHFSRTLLDPLHEGVVLYDRGGWSSWHRRFEEALAKGLITRSGTTWIWHRSSEPPDSPRLQEERRLKDMWRARRAKSTSGGARP